MARYTLNKYHDKSSVSNMLVSLWWEPLQQRRLHFKLCMVYKSIHGIACMPINDYLVPKPRMTTHNFQFLLPDTRVDCFKYSFFPSIVHPWNNLSKMIVAADTYVQSLQTIDVEATSGDIRKVTFGQRLAARRRNHECFVLQ